MGDVFVEDDLNGLILRKAAINQFRGFSDKDRHNDKAMICIRKVEQENERNMVLRHLEQNITSKL